MNTFTQHIPRYVDGTPKSLNFETTDDLLSLDGVHQYTNDKGFSHFAISDNCLMSISNDGFNWWVVGYIKDVSSINLPKWEGWKFKAEMPDGSISIVGSEVSSSCGDVLTLRDGTTCRKIRS